VPVEQVRRYMAELQEFMNGRHPEVGREISEKKELTDELKKKLDSALREFRDVFQAQAG
jgi:F-type H+/Na+-transporting ATPase subunit alpha